MIVTLTDIATANPPFRLSQETVLTTLSKKRKLSKIEKVLYHRFLKDKGIQTRHFSVQSFDDFFAEDQNILIHRFEEAAAKLSAAAVEKCIRKSGVPREKIGCIAISTCTGYICPGLTSHVIERCGLKSGIYAVDLAGMGCGGALPVLQTCHNYLSANPDSYALMVSTEICSSAIFWGDDPELILSNSIFGDGSSAALLTNKKNARGFQVLGFESRVEPRHRELLRFKTEDSRLRNVIKPAVPDTAAQITRELTSALFRKHGVTQEQIRHWAIHPGGKKVLDRIQDALNLDAAALADSRGVLFDYGNMSSPSVVFVLERIWKNRRVKKGDLALMAAFGAGFSAYGALLKRY